MRRVPQVSGLYAITPDIDEDAELFSRVELALRGGLRVLQHRDKALHASRLLSRARHLRALCHAYEALFIVNDNIDIAVEVSAHGVHLASAHRAGGGRAHRCVLL